MSVSTKIEFENENQVYYSGQVLKGRATLTIVEEKLLRGIYIRIHGFGHCEWRHSSGVYGRKTEGNETYIDERIYVVGSEETNSSDICVVVGTYTYPFECQLPVEIPSSLVAENGSITYSANLILDRPSWQIPTPDFPFTVVKPFDLSTDFTTQEPLHKTIDQEFNVCCLICCWTSNPMTINLDIPKTGFIPNETITIDLDVKNPSSEDVSTFMMQIIKTIETFANDGNDLTSDGKERSESKDTVIVEHTADGLSCGDDRKFKTEIIVPNTQPTDITTSQIFKISYTLRVIAVTGLCHEDVQFNIPIKIGTDVDRRSQAFNASERCRHPIIHQPTASPSADNVTEPLLTKIGHKSNYDPPTYEEATISNSSKSPLKL